MTRIAMVPFAGPVKRYHESAESILNTPHPGAGAPEDGQTRLAPGVPEVLLGQDAAKLLMTVAVHGE
jgi:hypothetical protein